MTKLLFHHVQSKQSTCDSDRKLLRDGSEGCPILLKKEISVQTCRLGTFYSKLAHLLDFRGLRTKVCRTIAIVSSSTQNRPWPGCIWDTQTDLTNPLYHAKIAILWGRRGVILCDTWSWIFSERKWTIAIRDTTKQHCCALHIGIRIHDDWQDFFNSSVWMECHLAVWMTTWGLGATFET